MSPYTNSQIYSLAVYLSNGLLVYAPIRPHVAHLVYAPICTPGLRTGLRIDPTSCYTLGLRTDLRARFTHRSGLTDRSKTIRFLACEADPANVEQESQQVRFGSRYPESASTCSVRFSFVLPLKLGKSGIVSLRSNTN